MQAKKVLHLIKEYLPPSQIWLYNLLFNSLEIEHHIGARGFLQNNFYHSAFSFKSSTIGAYYNYLLQLDKGAIRNRLEHLMLWPQKWIHPTEEKEWTQYIKKNDIQIIHAHFANHACEHMDWVKKTGLPFVVSFYGYDYEQVPFTRPRYIKQYQKLFKYADSILCEGPHGVETLIKMGCPPSKLKVVPLGIDMEEWQVMPIHSKKQDSLKLLQIANFTYKKGQLDTIEATIQAKKQLPNLELTLVGSPKHNDYFDTCLELIKKAENKHWIKYIPFVEYEKLKNLIVEHDVFIHPSKYTTDKDCEGGAPTILFNVQAMGMPVISTKHCDIPFVVKDKTSGLLSIEGDIKALVENIYYFYNLNEKDFQQWQMNTYDWSSISGNIKNSTIILLKIYDA